MDFLSYHKMSLKARTLSRVVQFPAAEHNIESDVDFLYLNLCT